MRGNNLSGGFANPTTPRAPVNYTGGLYAADLFLAHVIPEIESSRAFKDGGLIDITFDEAFPPFTYTGNSFANSQRVAPDAHTSILNDSAAETLFGRQVHFEPTGPNTPLATDSQGNQLYPGPGYNAFVDRPSNCVAQTTPTKPAGTCLLGGGGSVPGARTDAGATAPAGSSTIDDNAATAIDPGRSVTGTGIPAGSPRRVSHQHHRYRRPPSPTRMAASRGQGLVPARRRFGSPDRDHRARQRRHPGGGVSADRPAV